MFERDSSFAKAVAARAAELGLTYHAPDGVRPIAVALPTRVENEYALAERARIANVALRAVVKVAGAALEGVLGGRMRAALLHGLSPFERHVLTAETAPLRLVTARADILVDAKGHPYVVEVNTTIPAMQGYSDIALRAWTEIFLERSGLPRERADRILAQEGTNADDLLDALLCAYSLDGGTVRRPSIALVHRNGDSQIGELRYLAERFRERGHDARTMIVDDFDLDDPPDIVYRHVFARLVKVGSPFATALRDPSRYHVYNPIAAHLEQKAALAALSLCAADDTLAAQVGLDDEERDVALRHIPWTRIVDEEILPAVLDNPERFVLKRSWDFGGKSVILGDSESAWQARLYDAAREGGWVIQERVTLKTSRHLVAVNGVVEERDLYVDASSYTSHRTCLTGGGGVRRASTSPIVNIQSGGGVMPVVTPSLFETLQEHISPAIESFDGGLSS